jgi:gamma-glutamylcysteine synthetase
MAKSKNTTEQSLITNLSRSRQRLYKRADAKGLRPLTDAEYIEDDALRTVIATAEAANRRDRDAQIAVARELVELIDEGLMTREKLEIARAVLTTRKRAA